MKVAQSCPTLCDPLDYTVHGILQARILEWVAFPFSRRSSQPRDRTQVSHVAGGSLPAEPPGTPQKSSWVITNPTSFTVNYQEWLICSRGRLWAVAGVQAAAPGGREGRRSSRSGSSGEILPQDQRVIDGSYMTSPRRCWCYR